MKFTVKKKIVVVGSLHFPQPMGIEVSYLKIFNQKPKTWERKFNLIISQIENNEIDAIIFYLATPLFLQFCENEYYQVWKKLSNHINKIKVLIIAFEENIHENFDYYDYEKEKFLTKEELITEIQKIKFQLGSRSEDLNLKTKIRQEIEEETLDIKDFRNYEDFSYLLEDKLFKLEKSLERIYESENNHKQISIFIDDLLKSEFNLSTFKEKKEIGYRIETFIEEIIKDVFFSIYVSKEQIFSEEFDDFLKIFEKYLQKIENINFSVDSQTTFNGTRYYFKSNKQEITKENFSFAVKRFNEFIELCILNPDAVMELLQNKHFSNFDALQLIQDFTKKYKRLSIDLKHQQEKLSLQIKQDIENSILELNNFGNPNLLFEETDIIRNVIAENNKNIVFSNLSNNKKYSEEDFKIIEIATKYGNNDDSVLVKSNIEILKDNEVSQSERKSSVDKLKSFLIKAGRKALQHTEDIGVKVLTSYLENLAKGG